MADRFDDWSVTASSNSTVDSISIAENMAPSNVNNAMRAIMAAAALSFGGLPEGTSRPSIVAAGSFWLDTTTATAPIVKLYDGSDDITVMTFNYTANSVSLAGSELVNDTSPQLGGTLDLNGNVITGLVIGTNVQAFDATLTSLAAVAGVAGDILYASGTDAWARLAKQTNGQFLKQASGLPAWNDVLTRGTAIATTSGTAHGFTSIPAGTNRIQFIMDSVSLTGSDEFLIQLGDSGGYETASYVSSVHNGSTGQTATNAFIVVSGGASSRTSSGIMTLLREDGNKWVAKMQIADSAGVQHFSVGRKTLSAELDLIRITRNGSDTFDAGEVNIFTE